MTKVKTGAQHLRQWLAQSGLTQRELADKLEMHYSHVSKLMHGKPAGLKTAVRIHLITGIPVEVWLASENGRMTDDQKTSPADTQLDVIGTTGGKATVATRQQKRENLDLLFSPRDYSREDALLGEIVRICLHLDKAGFAKIYATAKAEEAAYDARVQHQVKEWHGPADER